MRFNDPFSEFLIKLNTARLKKDGLFNFIQSYSDIKVYYLFALKDNRSVIINKLSNKINFYETLDVGIEEIFKKGLEYPDKTFFIFSNYLRGEYRVLSKNSILKKSYLFFLPKTYNDIINDEFIKE